MRRTIVVSVVFVIPALLMAALWFARPASSAPLAQEINGTGAAWYHPDWHYRRPVIVTNTASAQANYPVLVTLDNTFDFTKTKSGGDDLRFSTSDGTTDLAYWIENWDASGQVAKIWVRIPSLAAGTSTIYLYYGNASANAASDGRMTFTAFEDFERFSPGSPPSGFSNLTVGEWNRYAGNPVLTEGGVDAWDESHATFASVISDTVAGEYRMYYHGIDSSGVDQIGLATSADGITWNKYAGNPILTPGPAAWDASDVRVPMVWKEGANDYRMLYTGAGSGGFQVGYATSTDGINWTKYAYNPVFNDPTWAHGSTENWGVIKVGAEYLMWYSNLGTPRQSGLAVSTDLVNWSAYTSAPIFASSGIGSDWRYSQFCPFTFKYDGYYYVLVPSYDNSTNYSRYYLYRSSSPYFPENDRVLVRVAHMPGATGAWDALDSDTPAVLTQDIQRSQFVNNQLWLYYAGASPTGGTWREGLLTEALINPSLYGAPAGAWGSLSWSSLSRATIVSSPVYQGSRSLQLDDTVSSSTYARGTFAQMTQGVAGVWVRRTSSGTGGTDLYVYGNGPGYGGLAALGGLGGDSRQFHYWSRGAFHSVDTTPITQWSPDTWYYVEVIFNVGANTYDFVAYDANMTELARVNGIDMWATITPGTYVNSAMTYTDNSAYVGQAFWDNYLVRKTVSPEPTTSVRSYSDIQERVPVASAGELTFTLTDIELDITTYDSSLTHLQVIHYLHYHPDSPVNQQEFVNQYWEIIPNWNASGYTATLTLPHPRIPDDGDLVCYYAGGSSWDCAASAVDNVNATIARSGITQFSEWTTQEDEDPTTVTMKTFAASAQFRFLVPGLLAAGLVGTLTACLLWPRWKRQHHSE